MLIPSLQGLCGNSIHVQKHTAAARTIDLSSVVVA